jgi:hypothetical protein
VKSINQTIQVVIKLLDKSTQLWTHLLEDGSLQELQEKETNIHIVMAEVNQQKNGVTPGKDQNDH